MSNKETCDCSGRGPTWAESMGTIDTRLKAARRKTDGLTEENKVMWKAIEDRLPTKFFALVLAAVSIITSVLLYNGHQNQKQIYQTLATVRHDLTLVKIEMGIKDVGAKNVKSFGVILPSRNIE